MSQVLPGPARAASGGGGGGGTDPAPVIEGLLLAAGSSRRMGGVNKLLADIGGRPMVRRIAEAMAASRLARVTVVLGHEAEAVAGALEGLDVGLAVNPDFADGLSTSLRSGLDHLGGDAGAVLVALGDMPFVGREVIDALALHHMAAATPAETITLPVVGGRRGNPVVWGRAFFEELKAITGDTGGRPLFDAYPDAINALGWEGADLMLDADDPEALGAARRKLEGGAN